MITLEWGIVAGIYTLGLFSGLCLAVVIGLALGPPRRGRVRW